MQQNLIQQGFRKRILHVYQIRRCGGECAALCFPTCEALPNLVPILASILAPISVSIRARDCGRFGNSIRRIRSLARMLLVSEVAMSVRFSCSA